MFPVEAFERTIGKFVSIAAAIDLPFHLTGGSISSAYGEPRLTQDIDIYPRERIPGELQRSQTLELFEGVFLPVVSRTDAAISKLIWIDKGSQRSRRDFRSIFRSCGEQQQIEIRDQATGLQLRGLLAEVLAESDEIR